MQALEHIDDPRSPSNGTRHDFRERLVVAICAMLSDNDTFEGRIQRVSATTGCLEKGGEMR